ncbi:MAG: Nif3-like dinuclear metal center hexameric protein [Candidatus Hodarchaeales archaeon]
MLEKISLSKLRQLLIDKSEMILLDVRSTNVYKKGHISGATSVPLHEIGQYAPKLPQNKPIVVYCQNLLCSMSTQAAHELKNLGLQNISKLEGGFDEWKVRGYPIDIESNQLSISPTLAYRSINVPLYLEVKRVPDVSTKEFISSDEVVEFLENRVPIFRFEYIGYEIKTVDKINAIYLMVNPDPRNLALVPPESLVICHHKISVYQNHIYKSMLAQAKAKSFNIYNMHLGWDTMVDGIGDSFLLHLGITPDQVQKVDLTYKGNKIPRLGSIIQTTIGLEEIIIQLNSLNVNPSVIVNPKCQNSKIGYIPGGGFVDNMIIEMSGLGVDVLVSSDPNWVVEIIARELGMTLIVIDHYASERYGLQAMQKLLRDVFSTVPIIILENVDSIQCPPDDCPCCVNGHLHDIPVK